MSGVGKEEKTQPEHELEGLDKEPGRVTLDNSTADPTAHQPAAETSERIDPHTENTSAVDRSDR